MYCNASWDTFYCWPATPAGDMVRRQCGTIFKDLPDLDRYPHGESWHSSLSLLLTIHYHYHCHCHYSLGSLSFTATTIIFTNIIAANAYHSLFLSLSFTITIHYYSLNLSLSFTITIIVFNIIRQHCHCHSLFSLLSALLFNICYYPY